jgi:hypothetical protein
MPHSEKHDEEFGSYRENRKKVLARIYELQCYLARLEQVIKAMPKSNASAGYVDLEHVKWLHVELTATVATLCDWDGLDLELSRLGLTVSSQRIKAPFQR